MIDAMLETFIPMALTASSWPRRCSSTAQVSVYGHGSIAGPPSVTLMPL